MCRAPGTRKRHLAGLSPAGTKGKAAAALPQSRARQVAVLLRQAEAASVRSLGSL